MNSRRTKYSGQKSEAIHGGQPMQIKFMRPINHKTSNSPSYFLEIIPSTQQIQKEASSRLGPSKLRKFFQSYSTFYQKSKTNRKLRISIEKAEQRLRQNNQDVEIYENLRNKFVQKKKKKGARSQSRVSSEGKSDLCADLPDLKKMKTHSVGRKRKLPLNKQQIEDSQEIEEEIDNEEEDSNNNKSEQIEKEGSQDHSPKRVLSSRRKSSSIARLTLQHKPSGLIRQKKNNSRLRSTEKKTNEQIEQKEAQFFQSNEQHGEKMINEEKQENNDENPSQKSSSPQKVQQIKRRGRPPLKKNQKGRPRKERSPLKSKKQEQQEEKQQHSEESQQKQQKVIKRRSLINKNRQGKHKIRHISKNIQEFQVPKNINTEQLERVRKTLGNRKQLIKMLSSMEITTFNVKQILDLGVTNVILDGQISKGVSTLLQSLKATLLHLYFPEDHKHKKKHEKLMKEKKKYQYSSDEDENKKNDSEDEQQEQSVPEMNGIRTKTVIKLQKMIKKAGVEQQAKNIAIEFENSFQQSSERTGQKYASIAYRNMRNLKIKLNQLGENQKKQKMKEFLENQLKQLGVGSEEKLGEKDRRKQS